MPGAPWVPGGGCYLVTPLLDFQGAGVPVIAHGDQVEIERVLCARPCLAQGYYSDDEETRILTLPAPSPSDRWHLLLGCLPPSQWALQGSS